jgi:uncharacterized protein
MEGEVSRKKRDGGKRFHEMESFPLATCWSNQHHVMYELTPMGWLLAVLAAVCIGMAKAGFGGLGMLAILVMARVLPPRESTGRFFRCLFLPMSSLLASTISTPAEAWFLKMIPPALVGIICGRLLMPHIPSQRFGQLIGWLTVALIALVLVQKLAPRLINLAVEHPGIAWPFGWLAGSTTMIANAAARL